MTPSDRLMSPLESFAQISAVLTVVSQADRQHLTPRQQQGLKGAEACIMLAAHPGTMDAEELQALAKAGLVFGAILSGER